MKIELDAEIYEYLATKKAGTQTHYKTALRHFLEFYKQKYGEEKTLADFLDELDRNSQLPRREKKRLAENVTNDFIQFLQEEKKFSPNTCRLKFAALQNYLKYSGFVLSGSFIKLPSAIPLQSNEKHSWKLEEIKEFVDSATNMRDKAIILCLFQSGLSVTDLCNLNYGDVKEELESGILPLCLSLFREKTKVQFKTFFGRDATKYLKLYLETRRNLKDDSPLFTMQGSNTRRITKEAIEGRFKKIAPNLSFIKKKELKGFNPTRPHSLRSAFNSQLIAQEINETLIEFFMAHSLGKTKEAYLKMPIENLRELYKNSCEPFLAIEKTSRDELQSQNKFSADIEKKLKDLEIFKRTLSEEIQKREKLEKKIAFIEYDFNKPVGEQVYEILSKVVENPDREITFRELVTAIIRSAPRGEE